MANTTTRLLKPVVEPPPSNEIEMAPVSNRNNPPNSSNSPSGGSDGFKKFSNYFKKEKTALAIPIISLLVTIAVVAGMIWSNGAEALKICRAYSLYSIAFLIITFGRMLWNVWRIQQEGHYRLGGSSHVSVTIKYFMAFMTLITVVGYYYRFSHMRIFWNFDFVLNYTIGHIELPIDVFCISVMILYLIFQLYYVIVIAPRIGVTIVEKCLFGTTLFINAFQKWLLETLLVDSEMCEHLRSHHSVCRAFIHYHSGRENLTSNQNDLYPNVESNASLTYTCTLELFMGCLALLLYLPAPVDHQVARGLLSSLNAVLPHQPSTRPTASESCWPKWIIDIFWGSHEEPEAITSDVSEEPPKKSQPSNLLKALFFMICAFLGVIPLYVIYVVPVIAVDEATHHEQLNLLIARLSFHGLSFVFLIVLNFVIYGHCRLTPIFEEPDLIILLIASFVITFKYSFKILLQCVTFFLAIGDFDATTLILSSITSAFEILTFFIFIHFTQKFFHLGHKELASSDEAWRDMFPTRFLAVYFLYQGLVSFAMYYSVNRLHIPFHSTGIAWLDNALSIFYSLYPTTTLFSMTMALCYGHIVEEFHDARLYDFKKQKADLRGTASKIRERLRQH